MNVNSNEPAAENSRIDLNTVTVEKLEQEISNMERYLLQSIQDLKYGEAETIKSRISYLKVTLIKKKKKELENQHFMELQSLEEHFNNQMNEFNIEWDSKIREFNEQVQRQELDMNTRHFNEVNELKKQFEEKTKGIKFSRQFLDLKYQQINLVKQQFFKEAEVVLKKVESLEKKEIENYCKSRDELMQTKLDNLAKKHEIEKNGFNKKNNADWEDLNKERNRKREQFIHKYKNKRLELIAQQKQEAILNENEKISRQKSSAMNSTRYFTPISVAKKFLSPESKIRQLHRMKYKNQNDANDLFNF